MSAGIHIAMADIPLESKRLLDRARESSELYIDGQGEAFRISRLPGRTAAEMLADPAIAWSDVKMDDDWAKDLAEIVGERKTDPGIDLWES